MDLKEFLEIKFECENQMKLEDLEGWLTGEYMNLPELEDMENEDH